MTARGFYTLLFGAFMLFTALSVGSAGAFLLGAAALIAWGLALLSVLLAFFTLRILDIAWISSAHSSMWIMLCASSP